jgi:hypothetical protein
MASKLARLWSRIDMAPLFGELRRMRRALSALALLFFTVTLVEVDLGHTPALAHHSWLALLPVAWLPVAMVTLMAVQITPSRFTVIVALIANTIAAAIGMLGAGLHMQAAGVDFEHLSRVFSSAIWGGHQSPNWPIGIAAAGVLGIAASLGADRDCETLPCDLAGMTTAVAYALIVAGSGAAALPALTMVSSACFVVAALLLLAAFLAVLAGARTQRSMP